jgi:hypothetical protein
MGYEVWALALQTPYYSWHGYIQKKRFLIKLCQLQQKSSSTKAHTSYPIPHTLKKQQKSQPLFVIESRSLQLWPFYEKDIHKGAHTF